MMNEENSRRPNYVLGYEIRLADGQFWHFPPAPVCPNTDLDPLASRGPDPEYLALLRAILSSEDSADRRRSELGLAIYLLSRNYNLGTEEMCRVFEFPPDRAGLEAARAALCALASPHLEWICRFEGDLPATTKPPAFDLLVRAVSWLWGGRRATHVSNPNPIELVRTQRP
jgi:hypothetical protein